MWTRSYIGSGPEGFYPIWDVYMDPLLIQNVGEGLEDRRIGAKSTRSPFSNFDYAIRAEETRDYYYRKFKVFLDYMEIPKEPFVEGVNLLYNQIQKEGTEWFTDILVDYIISLKNKVSKREITAGTLRNYYKPIRLFCSMNRIILDWEMIARGIPAGRRAAMDRAPTLEEIYKILEFPSDERVKPIVLTMVSSGIRVGSWAYLKWKHIIPILKSADNDEIVIAAKVIVYSGEPEQYFTFMTPEAYNSLKGWMAFRASYGEKVTGESWLMRDMWRTSDVRYGARMGLAATPKQLKVNGIRSLFTHVYFKQGIRSVAAVVDNANNSGRSGQQFRHEFKMLHGFRKYFKTVCEQGGMKPANVELLMGHDLGLSQSYYKPTESQLLEDYLKVVNSLTIDKAFKLQKQLLETKKENTLYRKQLDDFKELMTQVREEMKEIQSERNSKSLNDL